MSLFVMLCRTPIITKKCRKRRKISSRNCKKSKRYLEIKSCPDFLFFVFLLRRSDFLFGKDFGGCLSDNCTGSLKVFLRVDDGDGNLQARHPVGVALSSCLHESCLALGYSLNTSDENTVCAHLFTS